MNKSLLITLGMIISTLTPLGNAHILSLFNKTGEDLHLRLRDQNLKTPVSALLTENITRHPSNNEILIFPHNTVIELDAYGIRQLRLRLWPLTYIPNSQSTEDATKEYYSLILSSPAAIRRALPGITFIKDIQSGKVIIEKRR